MKVYRIDSKLVPFTGKKYYIGLTNKKEITEILRVEKIDLVHVLSYTGLGYKTILACKDNKIPCIYGFHVQPENLTKPINFDFKFVHKKIINRFKKLCGLCDLIITPSQFARNLIKGYGIKVPISIISNGINLKNFNKGKASDKLFRKKFKVFGDYLLYVGRISKEKNLEVLIKSAQYLKIQVIIVGDGPDKKRLLNLVKQLNLSKKIKFVGKIKELYLKSAYVGCKFLVHPSLIELEGMSILESMAFAKPILVAKTNTSSASGFVKKNGFTFNAYDEKDLARKIKIMLSNPQKLNSMGKESYAIVKKYDFNKSLLKMENIFKSQIKNNL